MSDYFSREARLARRARRIAEFDGLIGVGSKNERQITTQNAPQHVIKMVREVLNGYHLPALPKLSYSGMRSASVAQDSSKLESGVITVFAELKTLSGINIGFDVPVEIRAGKVVEPSVVVIDGAPRIIAQSTFDDMVNRSTLHDTRPVRSMFAPPMRKDLAAQAYSNRNKVTRVNTGMFSLGPNRRALKDAIAGRTASIREASPEDYDSDTEHESPDVERNHQDDDYLDPAERMEQHNIYIGQETSLKESLEIGDRGGVKYDLPKGTKCTIVRDHAGDNKTFVVRFDDDNKLEAIVERHFLKGAASIKAPKTPKMPSPSKPPKPPKPSAQPKSEKPKNPPAPKAPPRMKSPPKPKKTDKPKDTKHPPLLKKKQPKVCPKCNQSPCVCHRRKGQAIEEIGVNIAQYEFPNAIKMLMKMVPDFSNVNLYRYKDTIAVSPQEGKGMPEMFWNGNKWVDFGGVVDKPEDRDPRLKGPHYAQTEQSFPFPPQFPKKCTVCGKTYSSMEEWKQLPPPSSGKTDWITDFEDYDIRNCACGSTLAVIVKRKVEDSELDNYQDDGADDEVKADLEVTADSELVAKVNEEVGGMRDRGLGDIDIRQAIQSKYGDEVVNAVFEKTAP
jgi:hypothetical protein